MFHRETGVFKTSYASDMALYPLPIARGTVIGLLILFIVIVPLVFGEYYLSIINLVLISIVGALGLTPGMHVLDAGCVSTSSWATPVRSRSVMAPSCR